LKKKIILLFNFCGILLYLGIANLNDVKITYKIKQFKNKLNLHSNINFLILNFHVKFIQYYKNDSVIF